MRYETKPGVQAQVDWSEFGRVEIDDKNPKLKLEIPLKEIDNIEAQLIDYYQQERMLREKSRIEDGKRILDDTNVICLNECESNINRLIRQKTKIQKEHKDEFDKLKKNLEEEKRIRDKDKVYKIHL